MDVKSRAKMILSSWNLKIGTQISLASMKLELKDQMDLGIKCK